MNYQADVLKRYFILFSSHIFSILTPLIIFPLMVLRIGEGDFGRVIFVQTLTSFFNVIVDYDFNLWGVREVSRGRDRNEVFSQVVQSKLCLVVLAIAVYLIISTFYYHKVESLSVLLSGTLVILAYAFNPIWFFQSKENVWGMALVNIFSKGFFILASYLFIFSFDSAWIYNGSVGIGLLIPGLIVFFRNFKWRKYSLEFKRGLNIFLAHISIIVYSNASPLWISLFLPMSAITSFAVGERIVFAARGFLGLYAQIIYPKICRDSSEKSLAETKKTHFFFSALTFLGGLLIFTLAEPIVYYFLKEVDLEVVGIVKWMGFLPTVIALNVFPYQWLLAHSFLKETRNVHFLGALISILAFPLGIRLYGLGGAVIASFIVEIFVTSYLTFYFLKFRHSK